MGFNWSRRGLLLDKVSLVLSLRTQDSRLTSALRYFGIQEKVEQTFKSILGYMPTLAHWGWNGNARRYWDFV